MESQIRKVTTEIRWIHPRDMPAVLDIENRSFEFPWDEKSFVRELRRRNCIGMVAETEEKQIAGFFVYELNKARLEVINFAVHPDFRRRGVGQQMIAKLVSKLSYQRRKRIELHVRESNLGALLFFRAIGFRAVSVLRGFYDDTTDDAYLMRYQYGGRRTNTNSVLANRAAILGEM